MKKRQWDQGSVDLHQWRRAQSEGVYSIRFLAQGLGYSESHIRSMTEGRRHWPYGLQPGSIGQEGRRRREVTFMGTQPFDIKEWMVPPYSIGSWSP